ncbi:MAG: valine--tRNA ligase [Deltaproteobacteria bacterium]|nr:valine--tRNA ligase [Deltaproteobacteria bacterium]
MNQNIHYNFAEVEQRILKLWEDHGCFKSAVNTKGDPVDSERASQKKFVIAIPPPNVTGRLHMGHALNNTLQDMLIRYKRMDGFDALWVPGTDHAGIATQTVVKKMLDAENVDYRALGQEKFVKKVWEWKHKFGDMILNQLKSIGCSCDWDRTRFTMDEGLCRAVTHTFKTLYDQGLIYRGKRIVNWCPVDRTALSDDEIETKDGGEPGTLWHIKYPFEDGSGFLTVATTRPETLFGDVAVAVNPADERYQGLVGKNVVVPLQQRIVKVIADDYVDPSFGTGCLKITPAHDPNDFEVGSRHNLTPITVMNEDATMNDIVPEEYRGLDRFTCREKAVAALKEKDLLISEEPRMTPLGRSYRSKAVIEYRLSDQWFVKVKPLAEKVLEKHEALNIVPARWNKVYLDWLHNIRDWCVSRQIWWGHRIPAWYCLATSADRESPAAPSDRASCPPIVSTTVPERCPCCGSTHLVQESDVLDTWFSSALWPMSILGWPDMTPDFKRYFPTSTLVTAKDIIFFWVARMNFMAVHFENKFPYTNVYINPMILDEKGETMSKSKGNGIDPMTIIKGATLEELKEPVREARPSNMKEICRRLEKAFPEGYQGVGADALRYTLIYLCSSGQQIKISLGGFHDIGLRFMTKLWNAARFIMMHLEKENTDNALSAFSASLTDEDLWIRARLQLTANKIRACLDTYDFASLGTTYYQYVWNDFCDWYIELCKQRLGSQDTNIRRTVLHNLVTVFTDTLTILSPLIPFVTEELYSQIVTLADKHCLWNGLRPASPILMKAAFPKDRETTPDQQLLIDRFATLQKLVGGIRMLRKTYMIKEGQGLRASVRPLNQAAQTLVTKSSDVILSLARLEGLTVLPLQQAKPQKTVTLIDPAFEAYLEIADYIDVTKEKNRLGKEIERLSKYVAGINGKLANNDFIKNASPDVVKQQQELAVSVASDLNKTRELLKDLESW